MNKFWERFFFLFAYITQGSSYMSPRAYGIMHRMHHAYTDTELDPHSPSYDKSLFHMMARTRNVYVSIFKKRFPVEDRFTKNIPEWKWFDWWGNSVYSRIVWTAVYVWIYSFVAPSAWWYILIPFHVFIGPIHGMIINWYAHKYGEVNFETDNTSKNLFKLDWLMLGEGYHNNHHKFPARSNFAWKSGEFDPVYPVIRVLNKLRVIKISKSEKAMQPLAAGDTNL
jgi:stearoyl-CoA desaturase (Delta-9 desaturase)